MPFYRSSKISHWKEVHDPDSILELTRDGSDDIVLKDKTSGEVALRLHRVASNRYALRCELTPAVGIRLPVANWDVSNTVDENIFMVKCNASGGAITVFLLAAADRPGVIHCIKKIDASANVVTIDGLGAETIDGAATYTLWAQNDAVILQSDGSNWHTLSLQPCIKNLLRGVLGVASTFDTNPTNLERCTDGDPTSVTGVGSKVLGAAGDVGIVTWDLGQLAWVLFGAQIGLYTTASTIYVLPEFSENGSTWRQMLATMGTTATSEAVRTIPTMVCYARYLRLRFTVGAAATGYARIYEVSAHELPL